MQLARVASGYPMAPAVQLGRTRMLRDMVARWNVQQAHNARPALRLSLPPRRLE